MAHAWTFETAASYWSANREDPDRVWDAFESAEEFLLDHAPHTLHEALRVIEVLVEQGGDRRTDGRDVEALEHVQRFLQRLSDGVAPSDLSTAYVAGPKGECPVPGTGGEAPV